MESSMVTGRIDDIRREHLPRYLGVPLCDAVYVVTDVEPTFESSSASDRALSTARSSARTRTPGAPTSPRSARTSQGANLGKEVERLRLAVRHRQQELARRERAVVHRVDAPGVEYFARYPAFSAAEFSPGRTWNSAAREQNRLSNSV